MEEHVLEEEGCVQLLKHYLHIQGHREVRGVIMRAAMAGVITDSGEVKGPVCSFPCSCVSWAFTE